MMSVDSEDMGEDMDEDIDDHYNNFLLVVETVVSGSPDLLDTARRVHSEGYRDMTGRMPKSYFSYPP
jgi:hypothetical protein